MNEKLVVQMLPHVWATFLFGKSSTPCSTRSKGHPMQSERDAFWSITGFALFVAMLAAIWF